MLWELYCVAFTLVISHGARFRMLTGHGPLYYLNIENSHFIFALCENIMLNTFLHFIFAYARILCWKKYLILFLHYVEILCWTRLWKHLTLCCSTIVFFTYYKCKLKYKSSKPYHNLINMKYQKQVLLDL